MGGARSQPGCPPTVHPLQRRLWSAAGDVSPLGPWTMSVPHSAPGPAVTRQVEGAPGGPLAGTSGPVKGTARVSASVGLAQVAASAGRASIAQQGVTAPRARAALFFPPSRGAAPALGERAGQQDIQGSSRKPLIQALHLARTRLPPRDLRFDNHGGARGGAGGLLVRGEDGRGDYAPAPPPRVIPSPPAQAARSGNSGKGAVYQINSLEAPVQPVLPRSGPPRTPATFSPEGSPARANPAGRPSFGDGRGWGRWRSAAAARRGGGGNKRGPPAPCDPRDSSAGPTREKARRDLPQSRERPGSPTSRATRFGSPPRDYAAPSGIPPGPWLLPNPMLPVNPQIPHGRSCTLRGPG